MFAEAIDLSSNLFGNIRLQFAGKVLTFGLYLHVSLLQLLLFQWGYVFKVKVLLNPNVALLTHYVIPPGELKRKTSS